MSSRKNKQLQHTSKTGLSLLGGLSPDEFLGRYWQKEPLLIRQALPGFVDPFDQNELAGLAMEPGVRARIIMERGGKYPWELKQGPFSEASLRRLPASHWTLLVQDVNTYVDAAALILDHFNFIPHWRADDLMVSFAPEGGSVGAHVDSYDVFLLQGMGRRRWQIQRQPDLSLQPDLDVRILANFRPEDEWVLEPGDMLYVPPGCAHYGVALDPCLTYSIGYRAPQKAELALALFDVSGELAEALRERFAEDLYADPDLQASGEPGRIRSDDVHRVRAVLHAALADDEWLARWFAGVCTKNTTLGAPITRPLSPAQLRQRLEKNAYLWRHDERRLAYTVATTGDLYVAFAGEHGNEELSISGSCRSLLELICRHRRTPCTTITAAMPQDADGQKQGFQLLAKLLSLGILHFSK